MKYKLKGGQRSASMETRQASRMGVEIRAAEVDGKPGVTLHAIKPGVVDDYGSLWNPHCFDESLAVRMPTLCWAHDWSEPLGPAIGYRTSDDGPDVDFLFSDFDAVPLARRAHAQVTDGTIVDCSVGFSNTKRRDPTDAEIRQYPGVREVIERADLDEISLVMRGAVPGAKVLAVRSAGGSVEVDAVVELAKRIAAGELTEAEAKAALALLADEEELAGEDLVLLGDDGLPVTTVVIEPTEEELAAQADLEAALAEAAEAEALVGRSR